MDKVKAAVTAICMCLLVLILVVGSVFTYVKVNQAKEIPFHQGDCITLNWDGVESWFDNIIARVDTVGKQNYGVKYWFQYGWSTGTGTWPFTLPSQKVACPSTTQDHDEAR